jgi:hypothetical protein
MNKNNIYIYNYVGLGNKIYDLIISLYLKQLYNCTIYFRDNKTWLTKKNDNNIDIIFVNIKKYVNIIREKKNLKIYPENYKIGNQFKKLNDFKNYFENNLFDTDLILNTFICYKIIFDIFNNLLDEYKKIFIINKKLLDKNIIKIAKLDYAIIHIRYGDKLNEINNTNKNIITGLYTPEYYYDQILEIKKHKIPIFILTDSNMLVKKFILDKYLLNNDKTINILDISLIDSFYLMINSSYLILSFSTLSYASIFLAFDKKNKTNILCLPSLEKQRKTLLDIPDTKKITKFFDSKYLLNYNKKLLLQMYNYYNNTDKKADDFYYK